MLLLFRSSAVVNTAKFASGFVVDLEWFYWVAVEIPIEGLFVRQLSALESFEWIVGFRIATILKELNRHLKQSKEIRIEAVK